MNELDSIRKMVDHFPGGRPVVALRLGKSDEVLRKELAGSPGFKLGLVDCCRIVAMCAEAESEYAGVFGDVVAALSHATMTRQPRAKDRGANLFLRSAVMMRDTSEFAVVLAECASDGDLSPNDMRVIEKEACEAMDSIQNAVRGTRAIHEAGKRGRV